MINGFWGFLKNLAFNSLPFRFLLISLVFACVYRLKLFCHGFVSCSSSFPWRPKCYKNQNVIYSQSEGELEIPSNWWKVGVNYQGWFKLIFRHCTSSELVWKTPPVFHFSFKDFLFQYIIFLLKNLLAKIHTVLHSFHSLSTNRK